jgi:hypothetical protein
MAPPDVSASDKTVLAMRALRPMLVMGKPPCSDLVVSPGHLGGPGRPALLAEKHIARA